MAISLKKTLANLRELESHYKQYKSDLTHKAIFRHILILLAKIAKKEIEEETTYAPQESGEQRFKCKWCDGEGYVESWEGETKTERPENRVIRDCDVCKGEGYVTITVIDRRKKTKKKDLYYTEEY